MTRNTLSALQFLRSTTAKLAATYLLIIMIMSIGFSIVFYNTTYRQLGRQVPPPSSVMTIRTPQGAGVMGEAGQQRNDRDQLVEFIENRVAEGRRELLMRLLWLNIFALIGGAALSYVLARRTLQPIEAAMDAQGRFVSDASHELRTPITALQTTNEVALRKKKLTLHEAKELIAHNVDEAVKLKNLSDGLLDLLQGNNKLVMRELSLQDVVSDALNNIVSTATSKEVTVHDEVANVVVHGNHSSLVQVATILLDNAVKYSHKKGTVTVRSTTKSQYVYLIIEDTGIGIHASDVPHIFDRFYRADRSRSNEERNGYGLGLAIARKITEQHDGDISVESRAGMGSTFTVKLPRKHFK
jgi:signal transduction histidine kinase